MKTKGNGLLDKMLKNTGKPPASPTAGPQAKDDRLAILAVELGLAGAQVLQENYGFTPAMSAIWLDKMLDKAKVNRDSSLAMAAVKEIDSENQPR
jgi:hypothetical protein